MNNLDHNIIMQSREKISLTGVESVEEFDENVVSLITNKGGISIKGENLHVEKLDLENHELIVNGLIYSLEYNDMSHTGGFFARLFK